MKCRRIRRATYSKKSAEYPGGIAQLGTRRTTMVETAPNKPAISSYAEWTQSPGLFRVVKKEPDSQEGTNWRGGRRSCGRVLKGENGSGWSGRRQFTSSGHQGDSVSRFGSPQEMPSFSRRIRYYAQILSGTRSYFHSGCRCPGVTYACRARVHFFCVTLRSATMRHDKFCILATLFILKPLAYCRIWSSQNMLSNGSNRIMLSGLVMTYCAICGATRRIKNEFVWVRR